MKKRQFTNPKNRVDMADICELAHGFTVRECEMQNIPLEVKRKNRDVRYTDKAQDVFNYYYGQITEILNV